VKKVKEDTNIDAKVKEINDECKIAIIDKFYSERYEKSNATIGWLQT
jgi:hypothetical protein